MKDEFLEESKKDLENKIISAVQSILKEFEIFKNRNELPKAVILKNCEGYEIFREILEEELIYTEYNYVPVIDNGNGYFIDVKEYLKLERYP